MIVAMISILSWVGLLSITNSTANFINEYYHKKNKIVEEEKINKKDIMIANLIANNITSTIIKEENIAKDNNYTLEQRIEQRVRSIVDIIYQIRNI